MPNHVFRVIAVLIFPVAVFLAVAKLQSSHSGRDAALAAANLSSRDTLNMRWHYDTADVDRFWGRLGSSGRVAEQRFLEEDLIFPTFYGGALALSLYWMLSMARLSWKRWLVLLPVVIGVVGDWTENLTQLDQLRNYIANGINGLDADAIFRSSLATDAKLSGVIVADILLLVLAWMAITRPSPRIYFGHVAHTS